VQVAKKALVGWVTVELDLADRVRGLFDAAREMRRQFGVTCNSGCRCNRSLREAAEFGFQHRLIHRFAREGHATRHFAWQARQRSSLLFCWRQPAPMLYGFDPIHDRYSVTLRR
jgi:ATP-dependent exoDNAse (exonuclease V) alpha subunit